MWTLSKSTRALRTIATYGRPHRSWLARGGLATVGVVIARLAMPWPLRGVVEIAFPRPSETGRQLVDHLPAWGEAVLWLGAIYVVLAVASGAFELLQRTNLMRFAAHTVHDLRAAAVRGATRGRGRERAASGDLIARVIGDSARIKAGLSGILVHMLRDGMIFLGVCAVLLWISPTLGAIFLVAGLLALAIGLRASLAVARSANKARRKEGDYASAVHAGLQAGGGGDDRLDRINASSARKEIRTTSLIARSSLLVHVVLALAVCLMLWIGLGEVERGAIVPGELFLFIAYALTVHRRMVQVGRQAARSGKVFACTNRLASLLRPSHDDPPAATGANVALTTSLVLRDVKLYRNGGGMRRTRLRRTNLAIEAGSRVAVVGPSGAGKSSLVGVMAGAAPPSKGAVLWDGVDVSDAGGDPARRVSYLPELPSLPATTVSELLGLAGPDALAPEQRDLLKRLGAWSAIRRFPRGLAERVRSDRVSRGEGCALALAAIVLNGSASVWVLDCPLDGLGRRKGRLRLEAILESGAGKTIVVALTGTTGLDLFDRVVALNEGRVVFDGTPDQWRERSPAGSEKG